MKEEKRIPQAVCKVTAFVEDVAEADVDFVDKGFGFHRVGFSAALLRDKGLKVGDWFVWSIRDGADIRPEDILDYVPPDPEEERLLAEQAAKAVEEELEMMWEEFEARRREEREHRENREWLDWPECAGDR